MTRIRSAALAGFTAILGGCGNSAEVRYKVSVEVDDNGTSRAGSSVMSFKLSKASIALASPYNAEFKGEAVAVDLGNQQVLFALLKDEDGGLSTMPVLAETVFGDLASGSERIHTIRHIASKNGLARELPRFGPRNSVSREPFVQYPLLVRFRELDRPESLEAVAPDALDQAFGPGVKLKRITVQITDEPVTSGVKNRLPWLEDVGRARGTLIPNPPRSMRDSAPVQLVAPSDFTTELYK